MSKQGVWIIRALSSGKPRKPLKRTPIKKSNRNAARNSKFYRDAWNSRTVKQCDECNTSLLCYAAHQISHILSKGAHPAIATDLRNFSLLCFSCHQIYEFGDRKNMRIYPEIQAVIDKLKQEYYAKK